MRHVIVAAAGAVALLAGGNFWQDKPASEWSEKEIRAMLTHSPWAKEVTVSSGPSQGPGQEGGRGGRGGGRSGGGMTGVGADGNMSATENGMGGRGGGSRGGGMDGSSTENQRSAPSFKFVVRWLSARSMQDAMQRANGGTAPPDQGKAEYVVAVAGFPAQFVQNGAEQLRERLKDATSLRRKGQDSIAPAKIDFVGNEQSVLVLFHFPQQPAITADDKQVEFVSALGRLEIRARFTVKDMTYNGKLFL